MKFRLKPRDLGPQVFLRPVFLVLVRAFFFAVTASLAGVVSITLNLSAIGCRDGGCKPLKEGDNRYPREISLYLCPLLSAEKASILSEMASWHDSSRRLCHPGSSRW